MLHSLVEHTFQQHTSTPEEGGREWGREMGGGGGQIMYDLLHGTVMKNLDPPENGPPSPDISKYLDPHGTNISGIG